MPAIWSSPRSWSTGELVSASLMNTHVRDNLEFLKGPPTDQDVVNLGADITAAVTSFADLDATNLDIQITSAGGDIMIGFSGSIINSTPTSCMFDVIEVGGSRIGGDDGLFVVTPSTATQRLPVNFVVLLTGIAAGVHRYRIQQRSVSGTTTLHAGAGTANSDNHPRFWVREVS